MRQNKNKTTATSTGPEARHLAIGRQGEDLAAAHLASLGLKPLARDLRTRYGEIDLIFTDGPTVIFVEVKTRTSGTFGSAADAVNRDKRRRLARAAAAYLADRRWQDRSARIDVVEVHLGPAGPGIRHWPDAFDPDWE